jgi:hypothetical protein
VQAVPCGPGFFDGNLDQGSWTLTLVALDATGQVKDPDPNTMFLNGQLASPVEIHTGEMAPALPRLTLTPLPQCRDGVDNDRDGLVDLDDSGCNDANGPNPNGDTECDPLDVMPCSDNHPGIPVTSP